MYKSVYDANKEAVQQRLNDAGREYRNAKRKSEIAAVTDFATNLVALIGRNKGVRYNVGGKNISSGAMEKFEEAQKRYHRALVDYKGIIAADSLKNKVPATTPHSSPARTLNTVRNRDLKKYPDLTSRNKATSVSVKDGRK